MLQDMHGNWIIKANDPDDSLFVAISVKHPTLGDYFTATLRAKKVSASLVSDPSLFFWLMPHKVAMWIYWHVSNISNFRDIGIKDQPPQQNLEFIIFWSLTSIYA